MNDDYRRLYLSHVFDLLDGPRREEIITRARRLTELWRATAHMAPFYPDRWGELLDMPVAAARSIVLAPNGEAEMLRHCMPFAGILDNAQRTKLRRAARG